MGVGAAIAAGNQGENGKIALFVMREIIKREIIKKETFLSTNKNPKGEVNPIEIINKLIVATSKPSPTRFIWIVNKPE